MSYIPDPVTRTDKYLAYIAGNMDVALPDHPITRKEHYLAAWAEKSGFEDVDVTGEPPLTLENAIGKPLKGLRIYGKSKQVTTTGAQLFPPPMLGSQEKNGITIDCMEDGKIRISGTAETNVDFYLSMLQLPAGTYTFSAGVNIDASTLRYALVTPGGAPYYDVNGDYTTDTIAETIDVSLLLRVYTGKTIDLTVQPMLNVGSALLPWEPYTGGQPSPSPDYPQEVESVGQGGIIGVEVRGGNPNSTYEPQSMDISTPNGLPGIPVASGGNYTDADGQKWVCDEIDLAKGERVQRIGEYGFTGAEAWNSWGANSQTEGITGFYWYFKNTFSSAQKRILNTHAVSSKSAWGGKEEGTEIVIAPNGNNYLIWSVRNEYLEDTSDNNVAIKSFKKMLGEINAKMLYCLAEPIRTPLSPETIAAYKQLNTYKGTTIIDNDAGAYMSVKYEKMK